MTQRPSRGRRRPRPVLRHHLEDEFDRELDRLFGDGRARRRDGSRRDDRFSHLAHRLLQQVLESEIDDLDGCRLLSVQLHGGGVLLTLDVGLPADLDPPVGPEIEALHGRLRAELARHLPRRRTPDVRVRFVSFADEGPITDEEDLS